MMVFHGCHAAFALEPFHLLLAALWPVKAPKKVSRTARLYAQESRDILHFLRKLSLQGSLIQIRKPQKPALRFELSATKGVV